MALTSDQLKKLLDLRPHPTCGFTNEIYQSVLRIPAADLPAEYDGPRGLGGFLYFLVTSESRIRLHRIRSDQMYHHYLGEPLEVLLLYPDGRSEVKIIGSDLAAGMRPQLLVPGGTYHAGRLLLGGEYALLGTSVWLRAEPEDVDMGDLEVLSTAFPSAKSVIASFVS